VEGNVPAVLLTKHGLPDICVEAFMVIGSRIWDLFWGERVVFRVVLEGELSRPREHRLLQFLEDFAIEGGNLGKRDHFDRLLSINWGFGRRLYVNRVPSGWNDGYHRLLDNNLNPIKGLTALTEGLQASFPISPSLQSSSDAVVGLDPTHGGGGGGTGGSSPRVGSLAGFRNGRTGALSLVSEALRTRSGLTGSEFDRGLLCGVGGIG
jgi:hypothetical protein